ncbi:MAG: hypothetical protein K2X32_15450, partial [Phycisphaerales bacterium]|nr:hypothetical protein [Phycisphaerales bacterium]
MDPITTGNTTTAASTPASGFSSLSSDEFVKIMFSELTRQDPLKPNDSNALLQQLNSIRSIEANLTLERKLGDLVAQNQMSTAGGLVGAFVSGLTETNQRVEGQVISVSQTANGPVMNLREGWKVPFKNVDEFFLPDLAENPTNPNPNPANPTNPPVTPGPNGLPIVNDRNATTVRELVEAIGGSF